MAKPTSRETLIDYALRALGHPVLEVNVDEDQVEDRLDEALQVFQEYHSDAIARRFFKYQVTQTDITNKYITLPDSMIFVVRVLNIMQGGADAADMFSVRYQMFLSDFFGLRHPTGELLNYNMMKHQMASMEFELNGLSQQINFSRHRNRLSIEVDWSQYLKEGDFIIVEGYETVDPADFPDVYNDMFLKRYFIALLKRQWGVNLIKFEGMQLPGGVTLNGRAMFDDAVQELQKIEEEMSSRYEMPVDFMVGGWLFPFLISTFGLLSSFLDKYL